MFLPGLQAIATFLLSKRELSIEEFVVHECSPVKKNDVTITQF